MMYNPNDFENLFENDNYVVDIDERKMVLRISFFKDCHFADEMFIDIPSCFENKEGGVK